MSRPARIVCAYVMRHDSGHAPNPFHGVCTLAICTPNHGRSRTQPGDWIIGLAGASLRKDLGDPHGWRLIYAMHVENKLDLDTYYRDPQYSAKIPTPGASTVASCGDNFYSRDVNGHLRHTRQTSEHQAEVPGTGIEKQDITGDRVFIAKRYWYFGRKAPTLPRGEPWAERMITSFANGARGLRNVYDGGAQIGRRWSDADLADFIAWLPEAGGALGDPTHWPDAQGEQSCVSSCSPAQPNRPQSVDAGRQSHCGAAPGCG